MDRIVWWTTMLVLTYKVVQLVRKSRLQSKREE